jgi:ATP-binding cassette subfamily B protein
VAFTEFIPYLATFAGLWILGQLVWRVAVAMIIRAEVRALEALYVEAMDELLAKGCAFFHDNYAGSLTKRALGFARRFEDVFDVVAFQVCGSFLPLTFAGVVLWSYSPWLVVGLAAMLAATCAMIIPLVRRRRDLVDVREAAANVVAGHLADSIANAEAVRAFAAREGRGGHPRGEREGLRPQDAALMGIPEHARGSGDVSRCSS